MFGVNRTVPGVANPLGAGVTTFNNVHFGNGNNAWGYDGQDAAVRGMDQYAWDCAVARVQLVPMRKLVLSGVPSYGCERRGSTGGVERNCRDDAVVNARTSCRTEHARVSSIDRIIDVDFKLHVPGHVPSGAPPAEVRVVFRDDVMESIVVNHASRQNDVVLHS